MDAECRVFNEEYGVKYFVVETKAQKAICKICSDSVAVLKEHNQRHYETKRLSTYFEFYEKLRSEKYQSMKRGLETQRNLFTRKFRENESVTCYKIVFKLLNEEISSLMPNFIEECKMEAANNFCPEKADLFRSISLSASTIVQKTQELGDNTVIQISVNNTGIFLNNPISRKGLLHPPPPLHPSNGFPPN